MAGEDRVYVPGYPGQGESLAPAFKQSGGGSSGFPTEAAVISGEFTRLGNADPISNLDDYTFIAGSLDSINFDAAYDRMEVEGHDWTNGRYVWETPGTVVGNIDSYEYRVSAGTCFGSGYSQWGLMFCYQDLENFYECRWSNSDSADEHMVIRERFNNVTTVIGEDTLPIHADNHYDVGIVFNADTGLITMRFKPEDESWGGTNTQSISGTPSGTLVTSGKLGIYTANNGAKYIYDQRLEYYV